VVLKLELPLDTGLVRVIAAVQAGARAEGLEPMMVGAAARDLLLVHVHGQRVQRATQDVDFAVALPSWDAYAQLQQRLIEGHGFRNDSRQVQRLFFTEPGEGFGTSIDLVPFGELQVDKQTLLWPPEMDVVMTVAGFAEALDAAVEVELAAHLVVKVASLPGLTILKLFAWTDRRTRHAKDAVDFYTLLRRYGAAGNFDRMMGVHQALDRFLSLDCDEEKTGAWLLGIDCGRIASSETMASLQTVLSEPDRREQLIDGMVADDRGIKGARQKAEQLLSLFMEGMEEAAEA
jgi:predicted nucleotidyltransferase